MRSFMADWGREEIKKLLKQNGLKVTEQRIRILQVFSSYPDRHLTAEEIYEIVKTDFPEIGLATVYRTIQLLQELHLVDRVNLDDGFVRYEIGTVDTKEMKHRHHHLICRKCGRIISFQDDLLEGLERKIFETTGFLVWDHEVKLYGCCVECGGKRIEKK